MNAGERTSRRAFLVLAGTGLAGLISGCSTKSTSSDGKDTWAPDTTDADAAQPDSGAPIGDCTLTEPDNPGPFYVPNVPVRDELDLYNDPGTGLSISGQLLDPECNPIADAVVEIWHADPTTVSVEELTEADSVGYDNNSPQMRYRGQIATDAEGRYSFHTKKPGWYLNGDTFRPMHIHLKVWVNGSERLTTQLYFEGDPHLDGDPWASPSRTLSVSATGQGEEAITFNIVV